MVSEPDASLGVVGFRWIKPLHTLGDVCILSRAFRNLRVEQANPEQVVKLIIPP